MKKMVAYVAVVVVVNVFLFSDAMGEDKQRVGVLRGSGINIEDGYLMASGYLLQMELQKKGFEAIQLKDECEIKEANCYKKACEKGKFGKAFILNLIGYGDEISGELGFFDATKPENVKTTNLDFEKDELEIVIPRMLTAVLENKSIEGTVTSQNLTEEESKAERYFESRGYGHAAIGGGFGLPGFNSGNQMLAFQGGYGHRWRRLSFEARGGFTFSPDGNSVNWNLLDMVGRYHFTDKNIAPFAGALGGIHYMNRKNENASGILQRDGKWGFATGVSGGVTFFRHLKVNLPLEVRYQHTFVKGEDANEIYITVGFNF